MCLDVYKLTMCMSYQYFFCIRLFKLPINYFFIKIINIFVLVFILEKSTANKTVTIIIYTHLVEWISLNTWIILISSKVYKDIKNAT